MSEIILDHIEPFMNDIDNFDEHLDLTDFLSYLEGYPEPDQRTQGHDQEDIGINRPLSIGSKGYVGRDVRSTSREYNTELAASDGFLNEDHATFQGSTDGQAESSSSFISNEPSLKIAGSITSYSGDQVREQHTGTEEEGVNSLDIEIDKSINVSSERIKNKLRNKIKSKTSYEYSSPSKVDPSQPGHHPTQNELHEKQKRVGSEDIKARNRLSADRSRQKNKDKLNVLIHTNRRLKDDNAQLKSDIEQFESVMGRCLQFKEHLFDGAARYLQSVYGTTETSLVPQGSTFTVEHIGQQGDTGTSYHIQPKVSICQQGDTGTSYHIQPKVSICQQGDTGTSYHIQPKVSIFGNTTKSIMTNTIDQMGRSLSGSLKLAPEAAMNIISKSKSPLILFQASECNPDIMNDHSMAQNVLIPASNINLAVEMSKPQQDMTDWTRLSHVQRSPSRMRNTEDISKSFYGSSLNVEQMEDTYGNTANTAYTVAMSKKVEVGKKRKMPDMHVEYNKYIGEINASMTGQHRTIVNNTSYTCLQIPLHEIFKKPCLAPEHNNNPWTSHASTSSTQTEEM